MADDFNPFLNAGLLGMMGPNIYEDPKFVGKPLKLPGYFTSGQTLPPTDALGKPIARYGDEMAGANTQYQQQLAQFNAQRAAMTPAPAAPAQGTTMNSIPDLSSWGPSGGAVQELLGNYQTAQSKLTPDQLRIQQQNDAIRNRNLDQMNTMNAIKSGQGGFGNSAGGAFNAGQVYSPMMGMGATSAPATATGPTAPTPPDDRQAYLDALANPGKVTTPGSNVPASPPLGTPSVMTAFLAAHPQGGGKGAGGYDNSGFFNTLNQLGTA